MNWQKAALVATAALMLIAPGALAGSITNNGTILIASDLAVDWDVSGSGSFAGSGSLTLQGTLNPGTSPGTIQFNLDTTFDSLHTLIIQIENVGLPGIDYDTVAVGGDSLLTLGGTLEVDFYGAFDGSSLAAGDTFDIATAAEGSSIQGAFDVLDVFNAPLSPEFYWSVVYGTNLVSLRVEESEVLFQTPTQFPVPEAETWLLLGMAVAALALRGARPQELFLGK